MARPLFSRVGDLIEGVALVGERVLAPLRRADRAGTAASGREQIRLTACAGATGLALGWVGFGFLSGLLGSVALGWIASRAVAFRARRYRREVDAGAAAAGRALAGALAAGRSVRAAFGVAAQELEGPVAHELSAVAAEMELGVPTELSLESLRGRVQSNRMDLIVAAVLLQRRSGGNLASLLRSIAATIEESDRLRDEARAASAQARFTSTIVLAMPVGVVALSELASPGLGARVMSSGFGVWLVGIAVGLQVGGALLVRRISRVAW